MKSLLHRRRGVRAALTLAVLLSLGAGVAVATIPDSAGVINACYSKKSGQLRVIDTERSEECRKAEGLLSWNQQGPVGPQGPAGSPGPSAAFATPTGGPVNVVAPFVALAELRLPAGSYVVNAAAHFENGEADQASAVCAIGGWADAAVGILELAGQDSSGSNIEVGTLNLLFADTSPEPFTLRLNCRNNAADTGGLSAHNIHLVAIQVGTLYGARWTPPPMD